MYLFYAIADLNQFCNKQFTVIEMGSKSHIIGAQSKFKD